MTFLVLDSKLVNSSYFPKNATFPSPFREKSYFPPIFLHFQLISLNLRFLAYLRAFLSSGLTMMHLGAVNKVCHAICFTNFDTLPLSHYATHLGTPSKVRHTSRNPLKNPSDCSAIHS